MKLVIFFLFVFGDHVVRGDCPANFVYYDADNCFYLGTDASTYPDASLKCQSFGGQLAKVGNVYENSFISAMLSVSNVSKSLSYIGVENSNGTWMYADGSPLIYQLWKAGEPNTNPLNRCAVISSNDGRWSAVDCSVSRPYFCLAKDLPPSCPENFTYSEDTEFCYHVQGFDYVSDGLHWRLYDRRAAESACQRMGAHLVSIHSRTENNLVYDLLRSNVKNSSEGPDSCDLQWAWIGLNGTGAIGKGQWTDGSPVNFTDANVEYTSARTFTMSNDPECNGKDWGIANRPIARFVCKMAPVSGRNQKRNRPFNGHFDEVFV